MLFLSCNQTTKNIIKPAYLYHLDLIALIASGTWPVGELRTRETEENKGYFEAGKKIIRKNNHNIINNIIGLNLNNVGDFESIIYTFNYYLVKSWKGMVPFKTFITK